VTASGAILIYFIWNINILRFNPYPARSWFYKCQNSWSG